VVVSYQEVTTGYLLSEGRQLISAATWGDFAVILLGELAVMHTVGDERRRGAETGRTRRRRYFGGIGLPER